MIGALLGLALSNWSVSVWVSIPPDPHAAAVAPADPDEVIVNGVRVRRATIRVRTDRKTGVASCSLKRASGDPQLDAGLCQAALACNRPPIKTKVLEACLLPGVGAAVRARYPGRELGEPRRSERP